MNPPRKMRHKEKTKSRGFTLIEILVVIAVIALLMSILLPALRKARGCAKTIVCASGMKQIALAFNAYGVDNDDRIPVASKIMTSADGSSRPWIWSVLPYINNYENKNFTFERPDKLWFCPCDKDPYPLGYSPHGQEYTSYALNGFYQEAASGGGWTAGTPEIKLGPAGNYKFTNVKQASGCMLMMETSYYGQVYDYENPNVCGYGLDEGGHHRYTTGFYHDGWMNIMYVDEHVQKIQGETAEEVEPPSGIKDGNYMFWPDLSLPDSRENKALWGPGY